MKLVIRSEDGNWSVLSVVESITIAPSNNSTVTTRDGSFEIIEVGFDYVKNIITVYSSSYTLSNTCDTYDQDGNVIDD